MSGLIGKAKKRWRKRLGVAPTGFLSGGTLSQYNAAEAAKKEVERQEGIMKGQQAEIQKAQLLEAEKTLSAEERAKRRKRASTLLTGGMGLMNQPQTAVQQLLGI